MRIPEGLPFTEAAPFGCAGVTTFNALRHGGAQPGDRVAVLGIGGLGHLAVQFAAAMGFETVAIGRSEDKRHAATERTHPSPSLTETLLHHVVLCAVVLR